MISQARTLNVGYNEGRTDVVGVDVRTDVDGVADQRDAYRTIWERDTPLPVSLDEAFDALGDPKRRQILEYLDFEAGTVSVDELATYIVRRETEPGHEAPSSQRRRRAESRLRHLHLPKLADCGMIDWSIEPETVTLTDDGREVIAFFTD